MSAAARWAVHLALVAAVGALVVARDDHGALLLFVPLALAPVLRWPRAPRWLVRGVPLSVRLLLAATLLLVLASQFLLVRDDLAAGGAGALGWGLALLGVLAVLGRGFWSPAATLMPAVIGLLVLAALGPALSLFTWFAGASALGLWVFAFVDGGPRRVDRRLAAFVAVGAGAAGGLALLLPWAQPRVERAVVHGLVEGSVGLAERSRLGEFARLARSHRVVLRVWTTRPRLLRGYVLSRFDGREWTPTPGAERSRARPVLPRTEGPPGEGGRWRPGSRGALFLIPPAAASTPGEDLIGTRVLLSVVNEWPLLLPARAVMVRAETSRLEPGGSGGLRFSPFEPVMRYAVLSRPATAPADEPLSEEERRENLALPALVDPRLRIQAGILADGAASDAERLARTVDWLRATFAYSVDVGELESSDPVAEFLFEKKKGYCSYFATAAALLLRLQGVPARYVKGFSVGSHNALGDHHRVRESDAHAWVDAWLPGPGWVEADPTPPGGLAGESAEAPGWLERSFEAVQSRAVLLWASFRSEGLSGGISVLADLGSETGRLLRRWPRAVALTLAAAAGAVLLSRGRTLFARWSQRRRGVRRRDGVLPAELRRLLRSTERHWARRGRERPASRGLLEHLAGLPPDALSPEARATSARVVDAVYRSAFSGRPVPAAELGDLRRDVARLD